MEYIEGVSNILSKGGLVSSNSISTQVKCLYGVIGEDLPDCYDYYKGIGSHLEGGNGYYYFTHKESKVGLERKLETIQKWVGYLSFPKTYHSASSPGLPFRAADIETQMEYNIELKEEAIKLFPDRRKYDKVVGKLLRKLESIGLIERENGLDGAYKVLSAFRYTEDLVDYIIISGEAQDEVPE